MSRTSALFSGAAFAVAAALVPVSAAGGAPGDVAASLTIIDAYTSDYPGDPNPITVCLDGSPVSSDLAAGEQVGPIEISTSSATVDVFDGSGADCSGTPTFAATVSFADGDDLGLVLTYRAWFTFPYQTACPADGTAWVMGAQAADITENVEAVDVYFIKSDETENDLFPIFDGLQYLSSDQFELPVGTYDFLFFAAGDDPFTASPLGEAKDVALGPETSTQLFLAGGEGFYEEQSGVIVTQRATDPCTPEQPTSSTSTSTTTSTTAPAVPGTATAATPISGAATYTG